MIKPTRKRIKFVRFATYIQRRIKRGHPTVIVVKVCWILDDFIHNYDGRLLRQ